MTGVSTRDIMSMSWIDCAYVDQGYELPDGWTWRMAARYRRQFGYAPEHVPCFDRTDGRWAFRWGVPYDATGMPLMTELVE